LAVMPGGRAWAAISRDAELSRVGIAGRAAEVVERDAQPFGYGLREGGLVALAVLVTAGENFNRAGWIDAHLRRLPQPDAAAERADRLARRNPAGLDIGGEADAAQLVVAGGGAAAPSPAPRPRALPPPP